MLRIFGASARDRDGLRRRTFLQEGALGVGSLALPQCFRLRAEGASHRRGGDRSFIDSRSVTLEDRTGRPTYLIEKGEPIRELVGSW